MRRGRERGMRREREEGERERGMRRERDEGGTEDRITARMRCV